MSNAMVPQKFDVKETLTLNSELISLANRLFGKGKWSHAVTSQTIGTYFSLFHALIK